MKTIRLPLRSRHLVAVLSAAILMVTTACQDGASLPTNGEELADEIQRATDEMVELMESVRESDAGRAAEEKIAAARDHLEALYDKASEIDLNLEQIGRLKDNATRLAAQFGEDAANQLRDMLRTPAVRETVEKIHLWLSEEETVDAAESPESAP